MDFDTAVAKSKECKAATNDDKLALYKYFKQVRRRSPRAMPLADRRTPSTPHTPARRQVTVGDCNIDRPSGFFDVEGKAKWDAWSSVRACPPFSSCAQPALPPPPLTPLLPPRPFCRSRAPARRTRRRRTLRW